MSKRIVFGIPIIFVVLGVFGWLAWPSDEEQIEALFEELCEVASKTEDTSTLSDAMVVKDFKELFALDGKETNLSENDIARRNSIAKLLKDWGLVDIKGNADVVAPLSQIKIISYKEKDEWILETKYNIGKKKET